jgi:peptidoglycan DL-endopeptidase CwlO
VPVYRLPRRYRYSRYGSTMSPSRALGLGLGAAVALAVGQGAVHAGHHRGPAGAAGEPAAIAQAIGYARAQLGKPYCWGGTGPSCYDCSGLVMEAYASAGVTIPRTSQEQWAGLPHVAASQREAGDLVLAPGADGTWASPGHVGLLIGRNTVEQAYATGYPIDVVSLGNFAAGAGGIVGYARPGGA